MGLGLSIKRKSEHDDESSENSTSKIKTSNEWSKFKDKCKKSKSSLHDNYDAKQFISPFRKPLTNTTNSTAPATSGGNKNSSTGGGDGINASSKSHVK